LAGVDQARGAAGHAVRHLVRGHVQRHQRQDRHAVVTVAEGHAEARVTPERVGVVAAVVDAADRAETVVGDAVAAVLLEEVVPGGRHAVVRVHGDRGRAGQPAVAPVVVGVGEDRPHARLAHAHVGGVTAAAGQVHHLVALGALDGGDLHGALGQAVAGAFGRDRGGAAAAVATRARGLHFVPLVEQLAV